jgi:hypothetical protein
MYGHVTDPARRQSPEANARHGSPYYAESLNV